MNQLNALSNPRLVRWLKRVVAEKALPFEPLIPNAETIKAIKAARRGELTTAASLDGLFNGLNADD